MLEFRAVLYVSKVYERNQGGGRKYQYAHMAAIYLVVNKSNGFVYDRVV